MEHLEKYRIAILTCWYGPFPWYFPYFIHSCAYNPSVDFLIITDSQESFSEKPKNVKFINKSMSEIRKIASERLGFEARIDYPYKLCDYKSLYGFLFPDLLKEYNFWEHADIDLIYGNIRRFLTDDILDNYDIISCRHDYIAGAFSLFRNNEQMNTLFMQSRDYRAVLSSPEHFSFDECCFLFSELMNGHSILDFPDHIQSMTWIVKNEERAGRLRAFFDFIIFEGITGNITWDQGKMIYKNTFEAMFYHLIKFKVSCNPSKISYPISDTFHFTSTEIIQDIQFNDPLLLGRA